MQIQYKGATPIEKNVIVVDEQGNEYEATYPKRAKGLVKSGRARFVDENKICLACPPNEYLEDKKMTDNIIAAATETANTQEITPKYILEQIAKIASDTTYITEALGSLATVEIIGPGDTGAAEKAKSIADIVRCRETTNQQFLAFYTKIYNDLMTQKMEQAAAKIELKRSAMLATLQGVEDYFDEEQMNERADSVLIEMDKFCNSILLDNN
ncbi:MAG: hypothetical protein IJW97_08065 [Clostridia bacterium]|nr:hypothetical protein [Clostridia bacterium]